MEGEDWGLDFWGKVIAIHIQEKSKKESSVPQKIKIKIKIKKERRALQLDDWVTMLCR